MTVKIDPNRTFTVVEEAIEKEQNPLHRSHLENILEHFKGEAVEDIDRILATLSPKAQYIFYGPSFVPPGQDRLVVNGFDEIRSFYETLLASSMREMQYDVEEMRVDDYLITQRGINRIAVSGASLAPLGVDVVDSPDVYYMQDIYAVSLFPFDSDGKCLGEQIFQPKAPKLYLDEPLDLSTEVGSITVSLG
jgi:hypothetical protein